MVQCPVCLEMMKLESEEMESYWIHKLNSERKFYEEHINQSEMQLHELQLQIQSVVNFIEHEDNQTKDNETQDTEETIGKLPTITVEWGPTFKCFIFNHPYLFWSNSR